MIGISLAMDLMEMNITLAVHLAKSQKDLSRNFVSHNGNLATTLGKEEGCPFILHPSEELSGSAENPHFPTLVCVLLFS